jgi:hypothetical protein
MKGVFSNAYSSGSITELSTFYFFGSGLLGSLVLLSSCFASSSSTSFKSLALPSSYSLSSFLFSAVDLAEAYLEAPVDYPVVSSASKVSNLAPSII